MPQEVIQLIKSFLKLFDTPNAQMSEKDWQLYEKLHAQVLAALGIYRLSDIAHIDEICRKAL